MTSFRFNFFNSDENILQDNVSKENIQWIESEEIKPTDQIEKLDELVPHAKMFTHGDVEIGHVDSNDVLNKITIESLNNDIQLAEDSHSDLVMGKYEGGLKVWECTLDLLEYLIENKDSTNWNNAKVLDFGCGAGLLGILAFQNGSLVTFQDYNKEVLECLTIPNVLLNIEEEESRTEEIKKCKFYSGDWDSFNKLLDNNDIFDYILMSETIYNIDNYPKIINILNQRLSKSGTAFVAAKSYYFGVGGGVPQFQSTLENSNEFNVDICWKSSGGIQREIIKIKKK